MDDARLDLFRRYNPFTSSSVGDPWEATYPDVPSINEHAFRGLWQLIEQKTRNPVLNCAGYEARKSPAEDTLTANPD